MQTDEKREVEAIIRMMVYLKFELLRNDFKDEADFLDMAIKSIESKINGPKPRRN